MRCAMCNALLVPKVATIEFQSKVLGAVFVPNIDQLVCDECGDILLSPEESQKVIDFVKVKERKAIGRLPISDFVSLNDAARILGITKQAFNKNPKIRNGFIFSVEVGGRRYYNRRSVEQFKVKGDGRYRIHEMDNITELLKRLNKPKYTMTYSCSISDCKPKHIISQPAKHKTHDTKSLFEFLPVNLMRGKSYARKSRKTKPKRTEICTITDANHVH